MTGLTSQEIRNVLGADEITKNCFFVGSYDQLSYRDELCKVFVINTAPSWHPGEHWVGVYQSSDKNSPLEFFDSYGKDSTCYPFPIMEFLTAHEHGYLYNSVKFQNDYSFACGHYVLYYLLCRCRCRYSDILLPLDNSFVIELIQCMANGCSNCVAIKDE